MQRTTIALCGATFAFCSHGEKLPKQGGLPRVVKGVRPLTEAKLIPGSLTCGWLSSCSYFMRIGRQGKFVKR